MANRNARNGAAQPELHGSIRLSNIRDIELRLGLSPPYNTCHAYAPYAKNAPHCSRTINWDNRASVPGLMRQLLDCPVPSTAADRILRQLARCAVCGIYKLHQDQASAIYEKWCARLFAGLPTASGARPSDLDSIGDTSRSRLFEPRRETPGPVVVAPSRLVLVEGDGMPLLEDSIGEDVLDGDAEEGVEDEDDGHYQAYEEEDEDDSEAASDVSVFSAIETPSFDVTVGTVVDASDIPSSGSSGQVEGSSPESTTEVATRAEDLDDRSDDHIMYTPAESEDEGEQEGNLTPDLLLPLSQDVMDSQESEEPPAAPAPISPAGFRPYSNVQDQPRLLKELLDKLTQTASTKNLHAGHIYAFRCPSFPGLLKIGYAKTENPMAGRHAVPDPVARRLAAWATRCGYMPELVFHVPIAHAVERTERLVHKTLQVERRVQDPPCAQCRARRRGKGQHNEWFEVDEASARRVVDLWRQFSEARPYDGFGRLNSSWSSLAADERSRVAGTSTMMDWVERMPSHVERSAVRVTGRLSISNATLGDSYRYDWQFILALLAFIVNASPLFAMLPPFIPAVLRLCLSFHLVLQFQLHS